MTCPVAQCLDGDVKYKRREHFRRHWMERHEKSIERHTCALCVTSFKRKSNLFQHIKQKHYNVDPENCIGPIQYEPNKQFINPGSYTRDIFNFGADCIISCPVAECKGVQFKIRKDLKRHWMEQHEEMIQNHVCAICGYSSKRRSNVLKHVKKSHDLTDSQEGLLPLQYNGNVHFINPHPFTKELVFGNV